MNFVVTGLSRSGTSLLAKLITVNLPNAFCALEPPGVDYVDQLPAYFDKTRKDLISGRPVFNRLDRNGQVADNPWRTGATESMAPLGKPVDENVAVGVKGILSLFNDAQKILDQSYRLVIILRDPIYTLGAWNDLVASEMDVCHITDKDLDPIWNNMGFRFNYDSKIERQAEVWEHFATLSIMLTDAHVIRYEDLCDNTETELRKLADYLGVGDPVGAPALENMNRVRDYPRKKQIRGAVGRICQIRSHYNYGG